MERDYPLLVVALTISAYWLRVGAMVVRARRKQHHDVGVIPERPAERAMWLVLVPRRRVLVRAAVARPDARARRVRRARVRARTARLSGGPLASRRSPPSLCLVLTIQCWRRMGRDWRMDISDRNTSLITDGLFARVRHPIYAFSIALMIATAVVLPSAADARRRPVHVVLMNVKARNEEAHLARMHGDAYRRYVERTGRFVPRAAARDS